jgi:hypothetical protein
MKQSVRDVGSDRAIQMVIVAVILLAVMILSVVGFSYVMGGITGTYAKAENMKVNSFYVTKNGNYYNMTFVLKNSGSGDATISFVAINGKPLGSFAVGEAFSDMPSGGLRVPFGQSVTLKLSVLVTLYVSDSDLNIDFHSASGKDYMQTLSLPS